MSHILPSSITLHERADNPSLGTFLQITPPIHHAIQLNTRRPRFVNDPKHGAVIKMQTHTLCPCAAIQQELEEASGHADFTITYPGLAAAIIVMLQTAGGSVQTQRRELLPLASPDLTQLAAFDVVDTRFLEFIHQHDRGLVHYGPGVNPAVLAAQAALAFRAADIVLPQPTNSRVHRVADRLERWLPEVQRLGRHDSVNSSRIVVSLLTNLCSVAVNIAWRHIYLAIDARHVLSKNGLEGLKRVWRGHVIGMLPSNAKLSPSEWDELRCWFGFAECVVPRHGFQQLPVDVVTLPFKQRPTASASANMMEIKRQEIWHQPVRNRLITKLAKQLAAGDYHVLGENVGATQRQPRVAVLVESVEHLIQLAKRLPEYNIVTGSDVNTHGLPAGDVQLLDSRRSTPGQPSILTSTAAGGFDFSGVDILVRADGGTDLPDGIRRTAVIDNGCANRLLLVDFNDRHHPQTRIWSQQRQRAYANAGWHAPDEDPMEQRVKQFLEGRS